VTTVAILDDAQVTLADAVVEAGTLLVAADDFAAATGWSLKPQGLCRGDVCVPVRGHAGVVVDAHIDAARVAPLLGRTSVVDAAAGVVAYAASASAAGARIAELHAPDFTLGELDGTPFTFSEIGRKKKLLTTWASW